MYVLLCGFYRSSFNSALNSVTKIPSDLKPPSSMSNGSIHPRSCNTDLAFISLLTNHCHVVEPFGAAIAPSIKWHEVKSMYEQGRTGSRCTACLNSLARGARSTSGLVGHARWRASSIAREVTCTYAFLSVRRARAASCNSVHGSSISVIISSGVSSCL